VAYLPPVDLPDAMHADPLARRPVPADHRYLDVHRVPFAQAPDERSRVVAEEGTLAAGKERRLLPRQRRELTAHDRVHPVEDDLHAAAVRPMRDLPLPASERDQLLMRHDRSLGARERCYRLISMGHKATLVPAPASVGK
jgi:hypothetical protein